MPAPVLVLWDVDHTLVHAGPAGPVLYESVLAELYGLDLPGQLMSMAGRTDTSIALEVLTAAGLDAARELPRFHAFMAAQAPALADMIREQGTVLPGVREALAAVASHSADGLVVQSLLTATSVP
ncbi:MAG: HAD family hydrolase, partial [Actinobacteria bacterium]|nr:HAD family hydrolase [Actinomycetota bacterium]